MRISDWSSDVCSSDLRARDDMREHRPEGDPAMARQIGSHRCMAMQVDIGIERTRRLGAARLVGDRTAVDATPTARTPLRLLGGALAFVKPDIAPLAHPDLAATNRTSGIDGKSESARGEFGWRC